MNSRDVIRVGVQRFWLVLASMAGLLGFFENANAAGEEHLVFIFQTVERLRPLGLQKVWDRQLSGQNESTAFRFLTRLSMGDLERLVRRSQSEAGATPQFHHAGDWQYISSYSGTSWLTLQYRATRSGQAQESVEGLLVFWRPKASQSPAMSTQLPSLQGAQQLNENTSMDRGKQTRTLIALSSLSVPQLAVALDADFKRLGFARASFSPSTMSVAAGLSRGPIENQTAAYSSASASVVFVVFQHRGETAVSIYWSEHGR